MSAPRPAVISPGARLDLLRMTLREISTLDPSNPANAGRYAPGQHPGIYRARNAHVYRALSLALTLGYRAGLQTDPARPGLLVAVIELPDIGQVSWHLPAHPDPFDGHTTDDKYQRLRLFFGGRTQYATR